MDYLDLLAQQYPSIRATATEIVRLKARLDLPKGTEHFVSDIHGAYNAFRHVMRSGSGFIRRRVDEIFGDDLTEEECRTLSTLIYYPERKLSLILPTLDDEAAWFRQTLRRLIRVCRVVASKYTRSTVESFLPEHAHTIIEELLLEQEEIRPTYYDAIIDSIIETDSATDIVVALAELIQNLTIARLHVIGDVYDRGPGAHLIMDMLMDYHDVDIQWGNHDIVWMGAAAGSEACMANVVRISLRYANLETMENAYGISLLPLASFAMEVYGDDPVERFMPKPDSAEEFTENEQMLMARMQKAIAIIQFKLEGQIIKRRPHYNMADRLLLDQIDHERGTVTVDGEAYDLLDTHFPTIDPADPYALTEREQAVVNRLRLSFKNSKWLQSHVRFLYSRGSMYLRANGHLLYHGCIPMNDDGSFMAFSVGGEKYAAKEFMDRVERLSRQGYFSTDPDQKQYGMDAMWYLWSGAQSPLFGKSKMATFERYFLDDPVPRKEHRNAYYRYRDDEAAMKRILEAFELDPETGRIVNGHVPVRVKEGESPVKANGRLLVIDGGFAEAYHAKTGIAGYTLIFNSYGLLLAAHQPFVSAQTAVEDAVEMESETRILERDTERLRVRDTDRGHEIQDRINDLNDLLDAYRTGLIKEGT